MIRRFDEPIRAGVQYRNRAGAYGLILRGHHALLTFQSQPKAEYQLPGGGIDPGETPIKALHREVMEETGWGIRVSHRLGAFQRYTYMPDYDLWARKICHIYLCHPTRKMGPIVEPFHKAEWRDATEASSLLANAGDRHFVQQFMHFGLRR